MIICSNCGAINTDETSRFCRKCGALLPITGKPSRIRIPTTNSKSQEKHKVSSTIKKASTKTVKSKATNQRGPYINREAVIFTPKVKQQQKPNQLELQEIPKTPLQQKTPENSVIPPKIIQTENIKSDITNIPAKLSEESETGKKEFLKEIAPKPFDGTIMPIKNAFEVPKKDLGEDLSSQTKSKDSRPEDSLLKQKQLEKDMSDVLTVLSRKLSVSKEEKLKQTSSIIKKAEKEIVPASMNEILTHLLNLDSFIEASALIKVDGTILASALSNRISDSLFLTIGQNLSMIGTDIIEGLSAGKLSSISIRGTEGVFDLAPVDKRIPELADMILMIFSHPRVKPGIISFAVNIVKKQIKDYLGIK